MNKNIYVVEKENNKAKNRIVSISKLKHMIHQKERFNRSFIDTKKNYTIQIILKPHFELIYCQKQKTNFSLRFQPNRYILFYIPFYLSIQMDAI